MLRHLFGEPHRVDKGLILEANRAIEAYLKKLAKKRMKRVPARTLRLELWSKGLLRALDELEQSVYCARKYGETVSKVYVDDMTEEERDQYYRHIYYYKNAFIRLFSILDKIGYFMNELFELKTEKIKMRFSYFTVLRTMHERGVEPSLGKALVDMKQQCQAQLDRLRNQRNMEIHMLNADLLDDSMKMMESRYLEDQRTHVEDIKQNLSDLTDAFDMACKVLISVFTYIHLKGGKGA
jgi:hypothetical protein